jgi:quinone-modifying oxidoreductase subunit QmoC
MAIRVNPKLIDDMESYGGENVIKCYHCGNCTAVCPHSEAPFIFPRRSMRTLQMGLEAKLEESLEPWLCYYCGQCSEQCPREAEPGETMMSLRRWQTSRYDFTGLSRLFYTSWKAELIAILVIALIAGAGFLLYGFLNGDLHVYDGPNAFLPSPAVHLYDLFLLGTLLTLLAINSARMWWFHIGRRKGLGLSVGSYLKKLYLLPYHFFTQMRYAKCGEKSPWAIHLILVVSYVIMEVLIMVFLEKMQAGPKIRWRVHALGYAASVGLIGTLSYLAYGRWKKTRTQLKHSHPSDWMFLVLLLTAAVTGVMQHILHRTGLPLGANLAYVVHMMAVAPLLIVMVVFSKWSHLIYRPLAMYFSNVLAVPLMKRERERMPVRMGRERTVRVA